VASGGADKRAHCAHWNGSVFANARSLEFEVGVKINLGLSPLIHVQAIVRSPNDSTPCCSRVHWLWV